MKKASWLILFLLSLTQLFSQAISTYHYQVPVQLNDGFRTASLSAVGIDSNKIIALTNKILAGTYVNIHSLLIIRDNKLVYENYFPGQEDFYYGDSSIIDHDKDKMHEIRSVTKTLISACVGIAISQGKIKSVNDKVFQYFPEYSKYDTGMKKNMTIRDLLTMSSGIQWREGDSASTNQEVTMMRSNINPVEYFLSQPMVAKPGEVWNYNGGCTQTLAAIITKTTGEDIDAFANKHIFLPLGIKQFKWDKTKTGFFWCAGGLWLTSRDMAKFGLLYVNKGTWNNKNIIPAAWIEETMNFYFTTIYPDTQYGYQFWGANIKVGDQALKGFAAIGNGGQMVLVFPTANIEIAVTAGNYYNPQLGWQTYNMIANEIFPAITLKPAK